MAPALLGPYTHHSSNTMAAAQIRALDRLKKAANLTPVKKTVELSDGSQFEFYRTPLTMAERERAQKASNTDDANAFALQLLIQKAMDENGQRIFAAGEIAELKNEVRDADLQTLMLAAISEDNSEEVDTKK
jgi:NAD(P)H-nitrite reductase large subunit